MRIGVRAYSFFNRPNSLVRRRGLTGSTAWVATRVRRHVGEVGGDEVIYVFGAKAQPTTATELNGAELSVCHIPLQRPIGAPERAGDLGWREESLHARNIGRAAPGPFASQFDPAGAEVAEPQTFYRRFYRF